MKKTLLLTSILFSITIFAQVPTYVPTTGLIGWWPFNGNANDESGNGNNGTVNGASLTSDRNGIANKAYSFDGINDYISVNSSNQFVSQNLTLSVIFKPNVSQDIKIIEVGTTNSSNWSLFQRNDYAFGFRKNESCNGYVQNQFSTQANNEWTHLILITNPIQTKLYKNGVLINTMSSSNFNSSCPLSNMNIGLDILDQQEYWYGQIDEIGIWNRNLNDTEIATLFAGCSLSITAQPQNQNSTTSVGYANFSVSSTATNPIYQWQTNLGLGFQNLSNAGQYSGTNSSVLNVSNLSMTNNNQIFRCIIIDSGCSDTTVNATLSIIDDASIIETEVSLLTASPNPTNGDFTLSGLELFNTISSMTIKDVNGKTIKELDPKAAKFSLGTAKTGVYFLTITAGNKQEVIKIIKE